MDLLAKFNADTHTKEAVKEYMLNQLTKRAISDVFSGKETAGYVEAKKAIMDTFTQLEVEYRPSKSDKKPETPRNV
jgi:hypothetical protein